MENKLVSEDDITEKVPRRLNRERRVGDSGYGTNHNYKLSPKDTW